MFGLKYPLRGAKFRVFERNCYNYVSKSRFLLTNIKRSITIAIAAFVAKIKEEGGVVMNKVKLKKEFMSQRMIGAFGLIF